VQIPDRQNYALWCDPVETPVQPNYWAVVPICRIYKKIEAVSGQTGQDALDTSLESIYDQWSSVGECDASFTRSRMSQFGVIDVVYINLFQNNNVHLATHGHGVPT